MSAGLLEWCRARSAWQRELLELLVRLESPSEDKAAVDRCGAALAERLAALGGSVSSIEQPHRGNHVRAEFGAGRRQVLLLGHVDTVWPVGQIESMPLREREGRLYGPGVFDMKAGIASALLAVRALLERRVPHWPRVVMLWTGDEEIGSASSRAAIEAEARRSDAVLVLEPSLPGGGAKTTRKGCGDFELVVHGVPAHAGIEPERGASAVVELARQILEISALEDPSRGVTINVGVVSGGTRPNVVPERATALIDVRVPTMADAVRLEETLLARRALTAGTRVSMRGAVSRPPLERSAGGQRLYERARETALELGEDLAEGGTGGGSDGNFTAALGVPTLDGLGPKGGGAHARDEHVELADLPWRAAFLASLLVRLER
ncbi:MAG TPA: M20 family metallopeptidase [Vicinamibacterales bacterium]|nr:M20 family metallopeptidase [Vicinamibacterales bacterium]